MVQDFTFSGDDQNTSRGNWRAEPQEETPSLSPEINRLLSAAVVSAAFRRLLLSDPVTALAGGYNGESFEIRAEELAQIVLIRATSLAEFAGELIDRLWYGRRETDKRPVHRSYDRARSMPSALKEPVMVLASPSRVMRQDGLYRDSAAVPTPNRKWLRY